MSDEKEPKIGQGSLRAFLRQGGKELSQALPAFKDSIQVVEEPGTIGNPTPQQVTQQTGLTYNDRKKEMDLEMDR
jgi:hypothetical protein